MRTSANNSQDDISKNPQDELPVLSNGTGSSINPVARFNSISNPNEPTPHEDQLQFPQHRHQWRQRGGPVIFHFLKIIAYDLVLWFFNMVIHTFFRDIKSRGTFNIPRQGPIIFVIAPHHNQFVDPLVVMSIVRQFANRRISFLVAAKSYRRKFIGTMAQWCSAIPVERAQDILKPARGEIFISGDLFNDEENLIIEGRDTKFTEDVMAKGLIGLPHSLGNAQVAEVISDTKLKLRKPFGIKPPSSSKQTDKDREMTDLLTQGTSFKSAPHIDNNVVFQNVFDHLNENKVLGMFPEGGSHDRPDLLPLKPGVAIMALGAAAKSTTPDQIINVIPVGMNYFHPHRFRSRVVVEFGKPIKVNHDDGIAYQKDSRTAVGKLLDLISLKLREVTVTCDDYDTLMAVQAARRLYTSNNRESIPLPLVVDMNRRLIKGYQKYSDNPDVIEMKKSVSEYNKRLMRMGLHDHQVTKLTSSNRLQVLQVFINRLFQVVLFFLLSLPGALMFSPVFIISRRISKAKAKEALAGSVVKIKANDVLGTWKIIVALVIAPMLYSFWSICGVVIIRKSYKHQVKMGMPAREFIHDSIPNWLLFVIFYGWSVLTTYASLRIGEIGVDYYKSLKPLVYSLLSHHLDVIQIENLKQDRAKLSRKVTEFCDRYGPEIFEDYDKFYRKYNNLDEEDEFDAASQEGVGLAAHEHLVKKGKTFEHNLSRTESFNLNNLGDVPIFSNANFLDTFTNHDDSGSISGGTEDDDEGGEVQEPETIDAKRDEQDEAHLRLRNAINQRRGR